MKFFDMSKINNVPKVAPFAGARIEIIVVDSTVFGGDGRSLRGSAD